MSAGRITANLPSRDFETTATFYGKLGFETRYRDKGWMILARDGMLVEFFRHPELDPRASWFSACLRLEDIDGLYAEWRELGLATDPRAIPRLTEAVGAQGHVPRMFALIDPDGTLWRVIETAEAT